MKSNEPSIGELLKQQNNLLEQTNKILENQNTALNKLIATSPPPPKSDDFVESIWKDEMRDGFLVTSHRKRLWNAQIGIIKEFDRICQKHNLRWFAYYGTLLGAVRHKGFIPWDDDVDIVMIRPDYEKFRQVANDEIQYPYVLDCWYDYRFDSDNDLYETQFPIITEAMRKKNPFGWPLSPLLKVRDCQTTMIEFPNRKDCNQGIWIDIFPFDIVPPFTEKVQEIIFRQACELLVATVYPDTVKNAIKNNQPLIVPYDEMENFLKLSYRQRALTWEKFMAESFFQSERVGLVNEHCILGRFKAYERKKFDTSIKMPFEKFDVYAPKEYDKCLKEEYGDWHKFVLQPSHTSDFFISTDIPYKEFFRKTLL